uniref:hAT-like transposase RNase-H fold domain-containing protein n=1 Tax=Chenopodium quinoa TaxID=63459 RepID=A0A803LYL7_CHEQI
MSTFDDDSDDLMETNSSQEVEAQDSDEAELSGSHYVTGNTFKEEIYDIGYTIYDYASDPNDDVKNMATQMNLKFDKYWENVRNINILMFIALILDPRNKMKYTEHIVQLITYRRNVLTRMTMLEQRRQWCLDMGHGFELRLLKSLRSLCYEREGEIVE